MKYSLYLKEDDQNEWYKILFNCKLELIEEHVDVMCNYNEVPSCSMLILPDVYVSDTVINTKTQEIGSVYEVEPQYVYVRDIKNKRDTDLAEESTKWYMKDIIVVNNS